MNVLTLKDAIPLPPKLTSTPLTDSSKHFLTSGYHSNEIIWSEETLDPDDNLYI